MDPWNTSQQQRSELLAHFRHPEHSGIRKIVERATVLMKMSQTDVGSDVFIFVRKEDFSRAGYHNYRDLEGVFRDAVELLIEQTQETILNYMVIRQVYVLPYPEPTSAQVEERELGLNNCFFKTETTLEHDKLRFQSKAEIAIHNELTKRPLLFFPNSAAVFGGNNRTKREPDFLICFNGKWGILEVMGDAYHTSATAVKDHERSRLFKAYGVLCMEFFDAMECKNEAKSVVDQFLAVLSKY